MSAAFDRDVLMAARYAYYVTATPFLPDFDYDKLESEYTLVHGDLPVGSSNREDYTEAQRALALYFLFHMRETQQSSAVDLL